MKVQIKVILLFSFLTVSALYTGAQSVQKINDYKSMASQPNANYYTIVNQKRAEFKKMDLSVRSNYKALKQFERWAYIWKERINSDGTFPRANQVLSVNQMLQLLSPSIAPSRSVSFSCNSTWTQIGPVDNPAQNGYTIYPGKGRINVVAVDPNNRRIMYAGSAAGGVWKTIDGGTSWAPMSDMLAGLGVSDILIDSSNSNIIYIATGDPDGEHIPSIGVFKSINGGLNWSPTGLTFTLDEQEYIRDIAFAPGSVTKIFALTNNEVKVSLNSGTTWANAVVTYPGGAYEERFVNIIFDPNDANKVVVSDYYAGLYISLDGGNNFAIHPTFVGGSSKDILKLIATPANNNEFYGLTQAGEFRKYTFNMTGTSSDQLSSTSISGFDSQEGYNQCLTVSPTNKNNVMLGGVNGYKSTNEGSSFSLLLNAYDDPAGVGFYVHPDHHYLAFTTSGDSIIDGHDGGIHKGAFSSTTGWTDLSNGLVITQPYNIAITQKSNGDDFMMANQDNDGFSKVLKSGSRQWVSAAAGDGTGTGIDISDSNIRYLGGTYGSLEKTNDGYASSYSSSVTVLTSDQNAAFVSPLELHPTVAATIYAGHNDIKKSIDRGANWTNLNSGLSETNFLNVTSNGTSIRIYAIGSNGAKRSDDDGVNWTSITPPTGVTINSFAAKENTTTVYATVSGYESGDKVFMSSNNGSTWTNISSNLPNIVMKKVFLKKSTSNDTLYLGTELGVYWKDSATTNWSKLGTNLPNVIISDLEFNYSDNTLFVGTFGRGMWKYPISGGVDIVAPVADVSALPAVTGQCSVASLTAPTATDNCAGSVTGTTTTTFPITSSTMVTWTYTDGTNTSTQTQAVTINDVTAPVADVSTLPAVTGQCNVASIAAPTATDNCAGSVTGTTTTTFPITSSTTVTWTYTDGTNTSTQTQAVTINDVTAPVADVSTLPAVTGQCNVASIAAPTATDNCAGSVTGTTTATFPITSSTTVTWTYTDGTNTSTQTQAVTINDVTAPVADATTLAAVTGQCNVASITAPTATDNCAGSVTGTTTTTFPITSSTTVTWTYTDGTNTSTQTQAVTINDVTAPVADATTLAAVTGQCNVASITAPTATDNCAGSVTGTTTTTFPITSSTMVTWTYTDGTNTSTQTQAVTINDVTAPVADVSTLPAVTGQCSVASITAPTATDNCAGSVTGTTTTTFPITSSTTVTWTYTDGTNTSTQTQAVTINDVTAPVADATTLAAVTGQCSVASITAPTATDNCAGSVTGTTTTTFPITSSTMVTWTYTDGTNTSTQTQAVTINDVTAPVADVSTLPAVTGQCNVASIAAPTATDNCAGSVTGTTATTFPITSSTTVTWTYTDGTNTSTQTQAVTITPNNTTVSQTGITLTSNATPGYTYQWLDCNNGNTSIVGATNQSFIPTNNGRYAVSVTKNGCSDTSSCYLINSVSLNENSIFNDIKIYPNPTNGEFYVDLGRIEEDINIIVRNSIQQIVSNGNYSNVSKVKLEVGLSKGIYFVEVTPLNGSKSVFKVVKN